MRRGQVSLLALTIVIASIAMSVVFISRVSVDERARRSDEGRLQALWLARSAVTAGVAGASKIETTRGVAAVQVTRTGAELRAVAELPGVGRAEVVTRAGAWEEHFDRAGADVSR